MGPPEVLQDPAQVVHSDHDASVSQTADSGHALPLYCPGSYGPAAIFSFLSFSSSLSSAFDLDGDDTPDNNIGSYINFVNALVHDDVATGKLRLLVEQRTASVEAGEEPTTTLIAYEGVDTDEPADASDDFTGREPFYFTRDSVVAPACAPRTAIPGTWVDGSFTGALARADIPLGSLGTWPLHASRFELSFAPAEVGLEVTGGRIGGVLPICQSSRLSSPFGNNVLWTFLTLTLQPDVDLDGDGLERIEFNSLGIQYCVDGDGTEIAGAACTCGEAIADGFSMLITARAVGAEIIGPAPRDLAERR